MLCRRGNPDLQQICEPRTLIHRPHGSSALPQPPRESSGHRDQHQKHQKSFQAEASRPVRGCVFAGPKSALINTTTSMPCTCNPHSQLHLHSHATLSIAKRSTKWGAPLLDAVPMQITQPSELACSLEHCKDIHSMECTAAANCWMPLSLIPARSSGIIGGAEL